MPPEEQPDEIPLLSLPTWVKKTPYEIFFVVKEFKLRAKDNFESELLLT